MDTATLPATHTPALNPDLALLSASTLAASGRLEEATAVLSPDGHLPSTPQGLDLLARIAVHSGDLKQARKLWEAALQADASYEPARRALQSIQTPWFALAVVRRIALLTLASAAACLALVGLLALLQPAPAPAPSAQVHVAHRVRPTPAAPQPKPPDPTPAAPTNESVQALKALEQLVASRSDELTAQIKTIQIAQAQLSQGQERFAQQLASLAASHQELSTQQAASHQVVERTRRDLLALAEAYANDHRPATNTPIAAKPPPPPVFEVRGATLLPSATGWDVRFDEPLFDRDSHFKPGSKALVTSAAKALVRTQEKLTICVVGFADNEPATWPWLKPPTDTTLGQSRADRVKAVIDNLAMIPPGALTATNGLRSDLPHPSDSRRNRTAVLRISRP